MQARRGEFTELLIEHNREKMRDFRNWIFFPGMLFESRKRWWDSGGERKRAHEGVDLLVYRTKKGNIELLGDGVLIPSMVGGSILSIGPDFLGSSVFVLFEENKIFALGHLRVFDGLKEGMEIKRGDPIGYLETRSERGIPKHIHISFGFLVCPPPKRIDWDFMGDGSLVKLFDPMPFLADEYELIEKREKPWLR